MISLITTIHSKRLQLKLVIRGSLEQRSQPKSGTTKQKILSMTSTRSSTKTLSSHREVSKNLRLILDTRTQLPQRLLRQSNSTLKSDLIQSATLQAALNTCILTRNFHIRLTTQSQTLVEMRISTPTLRVSSMLKEIWDTIGTGSRPNQQKKLSTMITCL